MSARPLELPSVTRDGTGMTSRLDQVKAVHVQAARRRAPKWLSIEVLVLELQRRGLSLALGEADEIVRRVLSAEEQPTFGA